MVMVERRFIRLALLMLRIQTNLSAFMITVFPVRSQRTARLQSSIDGSTLFNIVTPALMAANSLSIKLTVALNFTELGDKVNISSYATAR